MRHMAIGSSVLFLFCLVASGLLLADPQKGGEPKDGFLTASGNIWTGVKLYYGPNKLYVGEVLGGNDNYVNPITGNIFRGLKIRMKSGSVEWKDRTAVITGDWYVKKADPALERMHWEIYAR